MIKLRSVNRDTSFAGIDYASYVPGGSVSKVYISDYTPQSVALVCTFRYAGIIINREHFCCSVGWP